MIWKMAVLMVVLVGCSERPLDTPNPPPAPPSATLWPLGGQIYHGIPISDAPSPDAVPTEPAEATSEEGVPAEAQPTEPLEEPLPEAPPTETPATEEIP
ncbi:MAG: hypothetical protein ACI8RZ_002855 [Myxococcota bacterium]|jgi:hypothetical protein